MLSVEDYEKIRKAVLVNGMSRREAAKTFGHSRKTVAKALKYSSPPAYRRNRPAGKVVVDPKISGVIKALLAKNKNIPRKQKLTGTRIHEILVDDYDFGGCVQTIRRHIAKLKLSDEEVFFKLDFPPGQAVQVDWGEAQVILNGEPVKVHLFCMRLAYSRASFVRAYPSQKMECFLDGHVHGFEFFGGVPLQGAYYSLKSAVIQVGKGKERKLNEKFIELRSHYLFNSRFCNVASGNEKGHAENLVKLAQRTFLAPPPHIASLEELNEHLLARCVAMLDKKAPDSDKTRGELLEEERPHFLPLPNHRFEACVKQSSFATKQSLIEYDCNYYSVPVKYAHHQITLKAFVDKIKLYHEDEVIGEHERCWQKKNYVLDYMHFIPLLEKKPGGIHNSKVFKGQPWGQSFEKMRIELQWRYEEDGIRKFVNVLLLFCEYEESQVKAAVKTCVACRAFNDEAVRNVLEYKPDSIRKAMNVSAYPGLSVNTDGIRNASEYDRMFLSGGVANG